MIDAEAKIKKNKKIQCVFFESKFNFIIFFSPSCALQLAEVIFAQYTGFNHFKCGIISLLKTFLKPSQKITTAFDRRANTFSNIVILKMTMFIIITVIINTIDVASARIMARVNAFSTQRVNSVARVQRRAESCPEKKQKKRD